MNSAHAEDRSREFGRQLVAVLDRWELDRSEQSRLLAVDLEVLEAVRDGSQLIPSGEPLERSMCLAELFTWLSALFPEQPDLRDTWIKRRNKALDDAKPLELMLQSIDGLRRVVRLTAYQAHT